MTGTTLSTSQEAADMAAEDIAAAEAMLADLAGRVGPTAQRLRVESGHVSPLDVRPSKLAAIGFLLQALPGSVTIVLATYAVLMESERMERDGNNETAGGTPAQ